MRILDNKRLGAAFLCTALLAGTPLLVGCGGAQPEAAQSENRTVQVKVTDNTVAMPDSLPTGATTFEVTNTGAHPHSFGIAGPAGDKTLDASLKPGETATLEMVLDEGTYRVYSPEAADQGKPIQIALHVVPSTAGSQS